MQSRAATVILRGVEADRDAMEAARDAMEEKLAATVEERDFLAVQLTSMRKFLSEPEASSAPPAAKKRKK
jgi:regulator of replication initiation timing